MTSRSLLLSTFAMLALLTPAAADSPFAPPLQAKPTFLRLLAFADYFDAQALEEFEHESGLQIAYDAYDAPESIPDKLREGPYDLVVLPGPVLRQQIANGALQKLDRAKLPHVASAAPAIAAKLAAYDPSGVYAITYMWFASGLLYDADAAPKRLGAPPASWSVLFAPQLALRLSDCGIATPDGRDDLFMAAWRSTNPRLAKMNALDVKRAADLLARLKMGARAFAVRDYVGALANGSACLSMGRMDDATLAIARAKQGGRDADIRFVVPREGAPMSLDALAIPKDAPHLAESYALLDFLLRPDIAKRNAHATGLSSGDDAGDPDIVKQLFPTGGVDASLAPIIEKEWERIKAPPQPEKIAPPASAQKPQRAKKKS
ncbi:extracellular solute-binding protein [Methylocapsa sp. S129]|uniref:extracellular solute-binding protein n=1 Tax=Methylocapsa sp. S129 TaxID=1641869 RepID=UPI00131D4035|nr:extracellular solute-binding protein [Methylocapsa sp. S129]